MSPLKGRRKTKAVSVTPDQNDGLAAFEISDNADALSNLRTCNKTKKCYASKVRLSINWFTEHRPECLTPDLSELKLPIPCDALLDYFGHLGKPALIREHLTGPEQLTDDMPVPLSHHTMQGYRSAIVDLYTVAGLVLDKTTDLRLGALLDGYEKLVRQLRLKALMKIKEGKSPINMDGYSMIADKLMKAKSDKTNTNAATGWSATLFTWSFFVLMWNLMSRSDSVDGIMLQHMEWDGDALTITEQGHKGDQTGKESYAKHIYANPLQPWMCPILSLAVLIFCSGFRPPDGRQQLYAGTDSKGRFATALQALVKAMSNAERDRLGCASEDIGTHSERKGSSTYCLGQVGGPTPVSVFLRMGQSLGQLKDRYIHAGEGADQLCGRMVCGLPYCDETFGVLPPHFDHATLELLTIDLWNEIVPGYDNYPKAWRSIFPFLLASLVHHEPYLRENLRADHPIWTERVFTANRCLPSLRGKTLLGIGACAITKMKASGIPPHLAIAQRLASLTAAVMLLAQNLPLTIAEKVDERIRESFVIEGVAPLSIRDLDSRFDSLRSALQTMVATAIHSAQPNAQTVEDSRDATQSWWKTWNWNDGQILHFVPPDWRFPKGTTVKKLWDLWYYGDRNAGIRPYRLINRRLDIKKEDSMMYSRATRVMTHVYNLVPTDNEGVPVKVQDLLLTDADTLFERTYNLFLDVIYCGKVDRTRKHELNYSTAYQLLCDNDTEGILVKKRSRAAIS